MRLSPPLHPWDLAPADARAVQARLAPLVVTRDDFGPIHTLAGVDVGLEDGGSTTRAAVAVLRRDDLSLVDTVVARRPTCFPYIPGLLSFREIPAVLDALDRLRTDPDLLVCDGQGYAHPRRFGLACHLGICAGRPSIGVAKSRLIGQHQTPGETKGAYCHILDDGEVIGAVLRTRTGVRPVYVSVGHRISLASAIGLVLACTIKYRLPETTRQAHRLASQTAKDG